MVPIDPDGETIMNRGYLPVICVVLSLLVGAPAGAAEPGFVSLFDGKTLDGWTINCLPKDKQLSAKAWTVDNGTILANSMGQTKHFYILLSTNKEYGDFVLRLRFQVERGVKGNSPAFAGSSWWRRLPTQSP